MFSSVACLKGPSRSWIWVREKGLAVLGKACWLSMELQAVMLKRTAHNRMLSLFENNIQQR